MGRRPLAFARVSPIALRETRSSSVNATGQFQGTVQTGGQPPIEFSGTLELLKVLKDLTDADADADAASVR